MSRAVAADQILEGTAAACARPSSVPAAALTSLVGAQLGKGREGYTGGAGPPKRVPNQMPRGTHMQQAKWRQRKENPFWAEGQSGREGSVVGLWIRTNGMSRGRAVGTHRGHERGGARLVSGFAHWWGADEGREGRNPMQSRERPCCRGGGGTWSPRPDSCEAACKSGKFKGSPHRVIGQTGCLEFYRKPPTLPRIFL